MTLIGKIKEDLEQWDNFMGDGVGLPYEQMRFMTGNELRDIGDRRVLDTYMTSRGYCSQEH